MTFFTKAKRLKISYFIAFIGLLATRQGWSQVLPDDGSRYAMIVVYLPDGHDGSQSARTAQLSFDKGCNAIEIGVSWDRVFPTTDSPGNWADIDYFVNLALQNHAKVALRINTSRRNKSGFWSDEQSMRDTRGAAMNENGTTHFRFGYEPAITKAQDFIKVVSRRYQYLQQKNNLLFMSITFNPQWEHEYWGNNFPTDGGYPYSTSFDFNDLTISDFQRWLLQRYKGGLDEINRTWGSSFRLVTEIRPPIPTRLDNLFPGKIGIDWFLFRHSQFKNFVDKTTQAIKSVDPTIRVINQHGSVIDINSGSRGTYAFKNLAELTDGIKVNDSPDSFFQLSMDLLRSNVKPSDWIMNEVDGAYFQTSSIDNLRRQLKSSFKYGAKAIIFANYFVDFNEHQFRQLLDYMQTERLLSEPVSVVAPAGTVTYKLSQIVQSNIYEQGIFGAWNAIRGSDEKPVRLVLDEDLLKGSTTAGLNQPPTVVSRIPNQTASIGKAFAFTIPDNTFADADGRIASVAVSGLPIGFTYDANSRQISGTGSLIGSTELTVTATDDQGATVSDYFSLVVQRATLPLRLLDPVLDCSSGRFELRSTDGDGTTVEYKVESVFDWTSQAVQTLGVDKRVNTGLVLKARQSGTEISLAYTTTCPVVNQPPVVSNSLLNQTGLINKAVSYPIAENTFSDPDGKIASVAVSGLPAGLAYDAATRLITGTPSATGTVTVTVTATDDKGATVSTTFTITISQDVKPLQLLNPTLNCDNQRLDLQTADGDGSPVEFKLEQAGVDWNTQHSYTLSTSLVSGTALVIRARQGGKEISLTYTTTCPTPNKPPVVNVAIGNQKGIQNKPVSFTIAENTFSDPDGKLASVVMSGLPTGLTYDAGTRLITGTSSTTGIWTITATATDDKGASVSTTFSIAIAKPLVLLAPTLTCETGRLLFNVANSDGSAVEYSLDGVTSWTKVAELILPTEKRYGGVLQIRARQNGVEVGLSYNNTCVRPNRAPVIANPLADQTITVSQATTLAIPATTFSDPDGDALTVTVTGLPVGLTYDPVLRVLRGTPALIGSSRVIAKATDPSAAAVSDTFRITVRAAPRFSATASLLDDKGQVIMPLADGDLLDSKKLPTLINLSCVPKATSGSVLMELTGKARRTVYANAAPYIVYPTGQGFKPEIGSYQLAISVYTGLNGTGNLLGSTVIHFDVVQVNEPGSVRDTKVD